MSDFQNSKLVSILKEYPLHTLLLAIFFILHSNNYYAGLLPGKDIFLAFAYTIGALALAYSLLYLICRDNTNAGIATTIFGILFLFFGLFKKTLSASSLPPFISSYKFLLPLLVIFFLLLLYRLKKSSPLRRINLFLNILLLIYIGIEVIKASGKKNDTEITAF